MIPLTKPSLGIDELELVKQVFDSGWVAGQGSMNLQLEKEFAAYVGTKYAVCVNNCTAGLHLALLALGIGQGDEVIVPDYTYPATAHAVLYVGAKPVFIDIDKQTYNINQMKIEEKITPRTKAIIIVHLFGQCADMYSIHKIAERYNLKIIEDAACAVGSRYKDRYAGSMSDVACFSFHGRKCITCGEGGIITTNNEKIANKIRSLACFGTESAFDRESNFKVLKFTELGYNYKLSDINAAVALAQLRKSETFINQRNILALYYNKKLSGITGITIPYVEKWNRHAYQSYVCVLDKTVDRTKIILAMKDKGIQCQIGTYALHIQPIYNYKDMNYPNTTEVYTQSIALPMYYNLTFEQIDEIVLSLKEVLT